MQAFGNFHMLSYEPSSMCCFWGLLLYKDARKSFGFGFNRKLQLGVASRLDSHEGQGAKVVRSSSCPASWQRQCTKITIDVPWITAVLTWSCSSLRWSHFLSDKKQVGQNQVRRQTFIMPPCLSNHLSKHKRSVSYPWSRFWNSQRFHRNCFWLKNLHIPAVRKEKSQVSIKHTHPHTRTHRHAYTK